MQDDLPGLLPIRRQESLKRYLAAYQQNLLALDNWIHGTFFKPWAQPYNFFRKCSSVDSKIYPENSGILSLFLPYLIIGTGVTNSFFFVSALATTGWVCFCKIFIDKHLVHGMHAHKRLCIYLKYVNFFTYKYRNHRFGSLIKEFRAWTNILQKQ